MILKIFFRLKVQGRENLPKKTNFIAVANHTSFIDPFILEAGIPRKVHCLMMRSIYHKFGLEWFFKLKETLPTGSASEKAVYLLNKNEVFGLFPEGRRSPDGRLGEFKTGAALLALKTGRPVVPCAILGAYEAYPRQARFPKFHPIKIKIGKPIYLLKEFTEIIDDNYLQEGIFKIRNAVKELCDAK